MSKILVNALLPFALFSSGILLMGCEQATEAPVEQEQSTLSTDLEPAQQSDRTTTAQTELKSGNMFYMVRDVADLQFKAGSYVEQLKQTQTDLQTAVDTKDTQQLQATAGKLQQQLTGFNQALSELNLKSQEIDQVRSNIMSANQQVLASPLLNGQVDFSQVDLKKIESQMVSVQAEMLKLAGMLIQNPDKDASSEAETENT
ncbi:primosomal replication protein PriC [Acinetobacter sp. UBA2581]|uniref:primosomal replication protein PriC n=1 Tax=Acinetobacter sp. UBA2581 TaxID=1945932 RepID=UPI00257EB96F|nr:primosomal replication protein PriC [Acinetobacter sp. UBA2581]